MKISVRQLRRLVRESIQQINLHECGDAPCAPCAARKKEKEKGADAFAYEILASGDEDIVEESPG